MTIQTTQQVHEIRRDWDRLLNIISRCMTSMCKTWSSQCCWECRRQEILDVSCSYNFDIITLWEFSLELGSQPETNL